MFAYGEDFVHRIRENRGWSSLIVRDRGPEAVPVPAGVRYTLTNRLSGKCLDVGGASTDTGAPVHQWDCHGGGHQQWRLDRLAGGAYRLVAVHSGKCLDVSGVSLDDGAGMHQWDCHDGGNQRWYLSPAGNGRYELVADHSGHCLAVALNGTANGDRAIQEYCGYGQLDERWLLTPAP